MTREEAKEEAIAQLERISRNLASIGEPIDYTEFAIKALEQEPCEDVVSRQAVKNVLPRQRFIGCEEYLQCLAEIDNLPPVTPTHSGWIPVGERPPADGEEVLMDTAHFGVITGVYDREFGFMTHYSLSSADMASVEVIAWMPLPSSYQGE